MLGHFGTADDFVAVDDAKALEKEIADASGQPVEFEFYEGAGHAFFNDTNRLGTYDKDAAEGVLAAHRRVLPLEPRLSGDRPLHRAGGARVRGPAGRVRREGGDHLGARARPRGDERGAGAQTSTTPAPTDTEARPRTPKAAGRGVPEDQEGGAGDEIPARSQALFTGRGGRISPRRGARAAVHRGPGRAALGRRAPATACAAAARPCAAGGRLRVHGAPRSTACARAGA